MSTAGLATMAPTLLIGLGGIGSQVVDQIYGMVPREHRDRIAVHAFDTNVNDISKLEHLKKHVTQTSTDLIVGQYLYRAGDTVKEWFPTATPELQRKTLTEGAGQIRLVSRLAYRSAIEEGKLGNLSTQITHLFQARPDDTLFSPRVMIVSSLAGGTGGGIFLQVAMYVRWLLETILGRQNIIVRGAFLLPDVIIQTGVLDAREHANIRANGYACLKELDAIVNSARSAGADEAVTIELEFRPLQQDAAGRLNFAITPRQLPYDFTFLYDFENTAGHNLKFLDNYRRQMAKTIYLQLFSPMSGPNFSIEDNNILNLIQNSGRSRYCGAGVSTLNYPYEEIIAYLSLCWTTETLSDHWLRLDDDYLQELRQYEQDLKNGVNRLKPDLGDRYISLLQNYGSADSTLPFFKLAYRSAYLLDKKGQPGEEKATKFIEALRGFIEKTVQQDEDLQQAEADCALDEGAVKIKEKATREVERREDALDTLKQKVLAKVQEHKIFIVNQALWFDCDVSGHLLGEEYQLNTWMLGRHEPLHPVTVRYLLYQIQIRLTQELRSLTELNKTSLEAIRRYEKIYDVEETEEIIETAGDRIRMALRQGFLRRLWENQFKDFIEEYTEKSNTQFRNLVAYKSNKLTEMVFAEVVKQVRVMLDGWELFFRNLKDTYLELLSEKNTRIKEHEGTADPSQIFVLASEKHKKALWEELHPQLLVEELPSNLAQEIYLGQYLFFCQRRRHPGGQLKSLNTRTLFQQRVVSWCREELRKVEAIDLNIIRALQKEASSLEIKNDEDYVEQTVNSLRPLAQPFIPPLPDAKEQLFWGIHPSSAASLTPQKRLSLFGSQEISHDAFSPREIICYRSLYGLKAEDFPKFSAGNIEHGIDPGPYFSAYKKRLQQLEHGNTITPHLDKRWHLPAYMPDLNIRQVLSDQEKIDRALILGLIYELFKVVREDQRDIWVHGGASGVRAVQVGGKDIRGHLYLLHAALFHNPAIVDLVLEQSQKMQREDIDRAPQALPDHRFIQGCLRGEAILEPLLIYPQGAPSNSSLPDKSFRLLSRLLEEIIQYHISCHGSRQSNTAKSQAAAFIEQLRDKSPAYSSAAAEAVQGASYEFSQWQAIIANRLADLNS